jgi:hypothetical protein
VLDASGVCSRRSLRGTAAPLVVENELAALRQRRKRRPQQVVIEEKSAVYADKRRNAGNLGREKHSEFEPTCTNGAP